MIGRSKALQSQLQATELLTNAPHHQALTALSLPGRLSPLLGHGFLLLSLITSATRPVFY